MLRVLGNLLGLPGFEFDTQRAGARRRASAARDVAALLSNRIDGVAQRQPRPRSGLQRIADVPIYFADPLVRRAPPLQKTRDAQPPRAWMNARCCRSSACAEGEPVRVRRAAARRGSLAALDDRLPDGCVRVAAAHPATAELGADVRHA